MQTTAGPTKACDTTVRGGGAVGGGGELNRGRFELGAVTSASWAGRAATRAGQASPGAVDSNGVIVPPGEMQKPRLAVPAALLLFNGADCTPPLAFEARGASLLARTAATATRTSRAKISPPTNGHGEPLSAAMGPGLLSDAPESSTDWVAVAAGVLVVDTIRVPTVVCTARVAAADNVVGMADGTVVAGCGCGGGVGVVAVVDSTTAVGEFVSSSSSVGAALGDGVGAAEGVLVRTAVGANDIDTVGSSSLPSPLTPPLPPEPEPLEPETSNSTSSSGSSVLSEVAVAPAGCAEHDTYTLTLATTVRSHPAIVVR
mmetsp:Transcript_1740/g.5578  ORF Transcript_1740/g.5578 Transcript_1740/m.5578 type:complete len:316 (-) Transcript_1740:1084-2031(-)